MTRYVVDASVAAKWYFPEESSSLALALLLEAKHKRVLLSAPDLVIYELGGVVLKKLRAGLVTRQDADLLLARFPRSPLALTPASDIAEVTLAVAEIAGISFYDAAYLATAQRAGCSLVTADQGLIAQVRDTPFRDSVLALTAVSL